MKKLLQNICKERIMLSTLKSQHYCYHKMLVSSWKHKSSRKIRNKRSRRKKRKKKWMRPSLIIDKPLLTFHLFYLFVKYMKYDSYTQLSFGKSFDNMNYCIPLPWGRCRYCCFTFLRNTSSITQNTDRQPNKYYFIYLTWVFWQGVLFNLCHADLLGMWVILWFWRRWFQFEHRMRHWSLSYFHSCYWWKKVSKSKLNQWLRPLKY